VHHAGWHVSNAFLSIPLLRSVLKRPWAGRELGRYSGTLLVCSAGPSSRIWRCAAHLARPRYTLVRTWPLSRSARTVTRPSDPLKRPSGCRCGLAGEEIRPGPGHGSRHWPAHGRARPFVLGAARRISAAFGPPGPRPRGPPSRAATPGPRCHCACARAPSRRRPVPVFCRLGLAPSTALGIGQLRRSHRSLNQARPAISDLMYPRWAQSS
jgi:hypothetical protein